MRKLRQRQKEDPTTSRSKVVASWSDQSRFLRSVLAGLLKFIRRRRSWPEVDGDLSSWIFFLHGFKEKDGNQGSQELRYKGEAVAAAVDFITHFLGPGMDVQRIENSISQSQKVSEETSLRMLDAIRSGDRDAFQSRFSEAASGLMDGFGIPGSFSAEMGISFDRTVKSIRALRATLVCLALYREHPFTLITRASQGDRRAVLDLVKADSLFLHDSCCSGTIRTAELQDDESFIEQMARALEYRPRLHRRDVQQIYCYILCLFEQSGVSLPAMRELWSTLDPSGNEYASLPAFEKDFQRRRLDFAEMLKAGEAEFRCGKR